MTRAPLVLGTLDGYATEGGFDRAHEPATCYSPTIALGRHEGPGDAQLLWHEYEQVLDLVTATGLDGVRLCAEWARVEPRRGQIDELALERYRDVVAHATSLGLHVTLAIVDSAWPSWLGLEAWLLPWVVPHVLEHARRLSGYVGELASSVVIFTDPNALVNGYLNATSPPWRTNAVEDARSVRRQLDAIVRALRDDADVGQRLVEASYTIDLALTPAEIRAERAKASHSDEIYVRSLVGGAGPTSSRSGLLERRDGHWAIAASEELLSALR